MIETLPGYKVIRKLDMGGMSTVFLAVDVKTNRKVAVKIMYPAKAREPMLLRQFERECSLLIKFEHLNIVKGYKYGVFKGLHIFVMEYINGMTLQHLIEKNKGIKESEALKITLQLSQALDYMHKQGYIHRDVKPANVIIEQPSNVVKLLDLGLASKQGESERKGITAGTPEFMSPEQAQGLELDARSDIYSMGIMLYYMLTAELPFKGNEPREIMAAQVKELLNSTELRIKSISHQTHYYIERMVSKEKNLRYQNIAELVEDVKSTAAETKKMVPKPNVETSIMKGLKSLRRRL
jgi:serine/threonine-protein kinase PpkA